MERPAAFEELCRAAMALSIAYGITLVVQLVRASINFHLHKPPSSRRVEPQPEEHKVLPSVAAILPVKWSCVKSADPMANWRSQVTTAYPGPMTFIFTVESKDDMAVQCIRALRLECPTVDIQLVVAGSIDSNTGHGQKIHNLLAGVSSCTDETDYVLFLDVNCQLHQSTINTLVLEMENDPDVFVATGYPLDIPSPSATVWSWAICQLRYLGPVMGFVRNRSDFVWGGAMMIRLSDIHADVGGALSKWRHGGLSDDMLIWDSAIQAGRAVATPTCALFPNQIKGNVSFATAWDFYRRQIFMLTVVKSCRMWLRHYGQLFLLFLGALALPFTLFTFLLFGCASEQFLALLRDPDGERTWSWFNGQLNTAVLVFVLIFLMAAAERLMIVNMLRFAAKLSPEAAPLKSSHLTTWAMMKSLLAFSFILPWAILVSVCSRSIDWGGFRYHVSRGCVDRIQALGKDQSKMESAAHSICPTTF